MAIDASKVRGMMDQIKGGVAFKNPLSAMDVSKLVLPSVDTLVAQAEAQAAARGLTAASADQIQTAVDNMTTAYNKTQDLLGHSDRLSGVNLSDGTLATIAKTAQSAKEISGEAACSGILAVFGAINNAAVLIQDYLQLVEDIENFVDNINEEIERFPERCVEYASSVTNQVLSDTEALAKAQAEIAVFAVANALPFLAQNECMKNIVAAVTTESLQKEITNVISESKNTAYNKIMESIK